MSGEGGKSGWQFPVSVILYELPVKWFENCKTLKAFSRRITSKWVSGCVSILGNSIGVKILFFKT